MNMSVRQLLSLCVFCVISVSLCSGACAEVDSDTEAVVGQVFELGCISCKMRGEVEASATVDWHFRARGEADFVHVLTADSLKPSTCDDGFQLWVKLTCAVFLCQIYSYDGESSNIIHEQFQDRLEWHGSRNTPDLQDASVNLHNVTFNDSGVYRCVFNRVLSYTHYEFNTIVSKEVHLIVMPKARRGTASIVSEVMMYVSIIGLQLWLLVEMIYCYRKIAAAGEEALRASAAEYLAITSESKDNCAGVQVAE